MNILGDTISSLTGNVESAYIIIKDYRKGGGPGGGGAGALAQKALGGKVNDLVSSVLGGADKRLRVQFNPNELQLHATSLPFVKSNAMKDKKEGQKSISDSPFSPTIELSTTLMFDQVNVYDAFMGEKFTGGGSMATARNIASAIGQIAGKTWTVQTEVEGLIAAIRNQYTRNVTFQWANFSFSGQLASIAAKYTMFSVSGRPIRAQVKLRIRQELDPSLVEGWYDDFAASFKNSKLSLEKAGQKAGNIFNLNL